MKKAVIPIVIILAVIFFGHGFFPEGNEIENYDNIQVIGIDQYEKDPSKVEITLISKVVKSSSGSGGTVTIKTISDTGKTIFEAERKIKAKADKITFLGYVEYILIGEKAAKNDFGQYVDYIIRNHEMRLSPKVFIVKDGTAKDLIFQTSSNKLFIVDRLTNILNSAKIMSYTKEVRTIDIAGMLDNRDAATIVPALKCKDMKNQKETGEMPKKTIVANGYAVIKDFKLAGYIDIDSALGYNFLVNEVKSCPINVKDKTGKYVALEVVRADTAIEAKFEGDKLKKVTYTVKVKSNIPEQQSRIRILTRGRLSELEAKQSEKIKSLMEDAIKKSKKYETDCFELAGKIEMQYPYKWEKIKDKWKDIYPDLKIDVVVESKIIGTYDINQPNGYRE